MKQFTIPVPLLNKHHKTPWVLPDKIYEDRFDSEHFTKIAPRMERLISKSYQSIMLPEESKKKILDLGTSSIMYTSLHRSHFDYILICGKMFLEGLLCPRERSSILEVKGKTGRLKVCEIVY